MIRNDNLVKAFVEGARNLRNGSMSVIGDKLFSYATCIAQRTDEGFIVNLSGYSPTTSRHQSHLRNALRNCKYSVVGKDKHIPRGTSDLVGYL